VRRWLDRMTEDLRAIRERDPAARTWVEAVVCMPGMHALWAHRVWYPVYVAGEALCARGLGAIGHGLRVSARLGAHLTRMLTGVEIHPGARVGRRVVIDHGGGVVIGETAEIGDDCTLYQGVTLGGVARAAVKRHPTLEPGVMVGGNAVILGPVTIGARARIGAAATVIDDVPAGTTMVGRPARARPSRPRVVEEPRRAANE